MQSKDFPGGWYVDGLLDGEFACCIRDVHVETHQGNIALTPGGNPLQLHVTTDGRIVGHGHGDGNAWEWAGGQWNNHGPAFGDNSCIYDAAGNLHVVRQAGTETGSLGWSYVDDAGVLIPSWQCYNTATPLGAALRVERLAAWVQHGGLIIGQGIGPNGGVVAQFEGKRYQIATGQTTFVRFYLRGNNFVVSWIQENTNSAHIRWMSLDELRGLPLEVQADTPPVVVHPPPPPPPPPVKEPPVAEATEPNRIELVRSIMAAHPEVNTKVDGERGKITDYVVIALGGYPYGRKDRDRNPDNDNNSDDAFTKQLPDMRFEIYDIINGDGTPSWDYKGTFAEGENGFFRGVKVVAPAPGGGPVPTPLPTATGPGASIDAEIAALKASVAALGAKVAELSSRPATTGPAFSLDGSRISLKSDDGHFLSADGGGGGMVAANRPERGQPVDGYQPGEWETWTVVSR